MVTQAERARRALLDWGCTLGGFALIFQQAFLLKPGEASAVVMTTGITLLSGPAGIALVSRLRNGGTDTTSAPSSTQGPPQPSGSPQSSTPAPEAAEA